MHSGRAKAGAGSVAARWCSNRHGARRARGSELRLARARWPRDAIEPLRAEHRPDKGAQLRIGQLAGDTAESIPQLRHSDLARGECGGGLLVEHTCTPGRHAACRMVDGRPSNRGAAPKSLRRTYRLYGRAARRRYSPMPYRLHRRPPSTRRRRVRRCLTRQKAADSRWLSNAGAAWSAPCSVPHSTASPATSGVASIRRISNRSSGRFCDGGKSWARRCGHRGRQPAWRQPSLSRGRWCTPQAT